ncbi:MAG: MFS transporter [Candidatus Dadabacteria bacterium]|nr:MFS transporter [Candidatus Dadabacteria bacterium]
MSFSTTYKSGLFNRSFILLTASSFLFFFNMHAFILLPVWIKQLGGSESDIGFIMGATSFSTIFSTPFAGFIVDRHDKKKLLLLGSALLVLSTIPFAILNSLGPLFYVLRVLHGFAFSLFFVSAGTLITEVSTKEKRTQALGIFGVFTIINYAFAPYLGRKIVELYSFDHYFIFISVIGILSLPFIAFLKINKVIDDKTQSTEDSYITDIIKRPTVIIPAITLMFAGAGFIPTLTFLPVFSLGLNITQYEIFFIWYTISVLFIRLALGWIPDKIGKIKTVVPSLILFSISILYLGFARDKNDFIIAGILFGFGHGFIYPTLYAIVIDNSRISERGTVFSICSVAFTIGGMTGAFIYGLIAEAFGFYTMYRLMGVVCIAGFLIFILYNLKNILNTGIAK